MIYTIVSNDELFGYTETAYDTEALTRTVTEKNGSYEDSHTHPMKKEEMQTYAKNLFEMESRIYKYKIQKLRESYEKKLAEIKKFQKALDI